MKLWYIDFDRAARPSVIWPALTKKEATETAYKRFNIEPVQVVEAVDSWINMGGCSIGGNGIFFEVASIGYCK